MYFASFGHVELPASDLSLQYRFDIKMSMSAMAFLRHRIAIVHDIDTPVDFHSTSGRASPKG